MHIHILKNGSYVKKPRDIPDLGFKKLAAIWYPGVIPTDALPTVANPTPWAWIRGYVDTWIRVR